MSDPIVTFDFEFGTVTLRDGTLMAPARDLVDRWVVQTDPSYRAVGPSFTILYEVRGRQFVLITCCGCRRYGRDRTGGEQWTAEVVEGERIKENEAVEFLLANRFDVPDSLADQVEGRWLTPRPDGDGESRPAPDSEVFTEHSADDANIDESSHSAPPVAPAATPAEPELAGDRSNDRSSNKPSADEMRTLITDDPTAACQHIELDDWEVLDYFHEHTEPPKYRRFKLRELVVALNKARVSAHRKPRRHRSYERTCRRLRDLGLLDSTPGNKGGWCMTTAAVTFMKAVESTRET